MQLRPYSRIVVDGMDGSGKSTLIKQLMNLLGARSQFVPGYNRQDDPKPKMDRWWMEQLGNNPIGKIVIHDRFFYSELVYGPVLRGKITGDPGAIDYVQRFLRSHALLIYCRPPVKTIMAGIEVEPQMDHVKPNFNQLLIQYDNVMIKEAQYFGVRFVRYDWTEVDAFAKLVQRVDRYLFA